MKYLPARRLGRELTNHECELLQFFWGGLTSRCPRCWAEGCGRLMVLHTPWALYLCERTPMGIILAEEEQVILPPAA
jgi:hypothetical protein